MSFWLDTESSGCRFKSLSESTLRNSRICMHRISSLSKGLRDTLKEFRYGVSKYDSAV